MLGLYVWMYSFGPLPQPRPTRKTNLVPAIKDAGFPTPLAVRIVLDAALSGVPVGGRLGWVLRRGLNPLNQMTVCRSPGRHVI